MNDIIDSVSYDQYKNIPTADEMGVKTKIIFSQEAYLKLLTLIKKTKDLGNETGCFFVGRQSENDPFAIIIDYFTSDFQCDNAFISGGSANPTEKVYNELNNKLKEYKQNSRKASVFHFHTHPRQLHYENFSDQDLSLYAKMALDNKDINAFGILGFPIPNSENSNGISIIRPIKPERTNDVGSADFFRFPNIYYCSNNQIYKVGSFKKRYDGRKYKQNSNGTIVRNAVENSTSDEICGLGINPDNGKKINDESVGYIDENGAFRFPSENLNIVFGSIKKKEEKNETLHTPTEPKDSKEQQVEQDKKDTTASNGSKKEKPDDNKKTTKDASVKENLDELKATMKQMAIDYTTNYEEYNKKDARLKELTRTLYEQRAKKLNIKESKMEKAMNIRRLGAIVSNIVVISRKINSEAHTGEVSKLSMEELNFSMKELDDYMAVLTKLNQKDKTKSTTQKDTPKKQNKSVTKRTEKTVSAKRADGKLKNEKKKTVHTSKTTKTKEDRASR